MIAGIVAIVIAAAIAIFALRRRSGSTAQPVRSSRQAVPASPTSPQTISWTGAAGDDFTELSEAQRCDLIFAIRDLPGDGRSQILRAALDDPSEVVALAAASALSARGERVQVERYFADRPGGRSDRIARDLSLLSG